MPLGRLPRLPSSPRPNSEISHGAPRGPGSEAIPALWSANSARLGSSPSQARFSSATATSRTLTLPASCETTPRPSSATAPGKNISTLDRRRGRTIQSLFQDDAIDRLQVVGASLNPTDLDDRVVVSARIGVQPTRASTSKALAPCAGRLTSCLAYPRPRSCTTAWRGSSNHRPVLSPSHPLVSGQDHSASRDVRRVASSGPHRAA
jgi:hypothetical protein